MTRLVRLKLAPHLCCAISTQRAAAAGKDGAGPRAAAPGAESVPCWINIQSDVGLCFPMRCSCGDVNAYCLRYLYKVLCD